MIDVADRFLGLAAEGADPCDTVRIEPGTLADYAALAHHHYKPGRPVAPVLVLRAVHPDGLCGVLVVTRPTLNGAWRPLAWPDLSPGPGSTQRLNATVRTIARVVVDPRWRGLGLGARLVRHYLAKPQTPRTEAVAAMGPYCRVFTAAGMREIPIPPTRADRALLAALDRLRLHPSDLACGPPRTLTRALRAWAWQGRAMRSAALRRDLPSIARCAAARLGAPRTAYVWPLSPSAPEAVNDTLPAPHS